MKTKVEISDQVLRFSADQLLAAYGPADAAYDEE